MIKQQNIAQDQQVAYLDQQENESQKIPFYDGGELGSTEALKVSMNAAPNRIEHSATQGLTSKEQRTKQRV